jgi:hypothetical protein
MKTCSYCGRQNEDAAVACSECGTGIVLSPAPEVDAQFSDPSGALVIVATYDNLAQASLLASRLAAADIEACIPEEYNPQLFSHVIPLGDVTVRVAAQDREAAEALAAGMAETGQSSAVEGALEAGVDTVSEVNRPRSTGPTLQAMGAISAIVVAVPILFGVLAHLIRESSAMGPLFWLWALFSIACLFWGRYLSRGYHALARGCVAVDMLQLILFLFVFVAIDFPANTRSVPFTPPPTRNQHDW